MRECCEVRADIPERQRRVLQVVLAINAVMFVIEFASGVLAHSTALLADSVDMLGDAIVYGFSLYVVSRGAIWQARAALLKGLIMAGFGVGVAAEVGVKLVRGTVPTADTWLRHLYRQLVASSAWRGDTRLVVTFDEGTSSRGIGGLQGGGHVATIVVGPKVPAGVRDATPYDHYALLRSIQARFGLPPLRHAGDPGTATIPALAEGPRGADRLAMTTRG